MEPVKDEEWVEFKFYVGPELLDKLRMDLERDLEPRQSLLDPELGFVGPDKGCFIQTK